MRTYWRAVLYFRKDWPLITLMLGIIALQTLLGLLGAWPMAVLVDSVLTSSPKSSWMHRLFLAPLPPDKLGQVIGLTVLGLLMKCAGDALSMVGKMVTAQVNYHGLMRVRCDLYRKLQALNLGYHQSQPQGDAIYRLANDTWGCQNVLHTLISIFVAAITLVVMTGVLLSRHITLTLLALAIAPPLILANTYFGRVLKARSLECKDRDAEFTTAVQRSMSLIGLVQAFGRETEEYARFRGSVANCIRAWFRLHWQEVFYWITVGLIMGIGGAVVFGYGGYLVWRDQFRGPAPVPNGMTLGDLMIFTSYLGMLWDPLCKLTGASASLQGGIVGAQRVFEVLDRDVAVQDTPGALSLPVRPRTLSMQQVRFAYAPGRPVLRGIDVEIKPGQMVAFVGASGVGKSTLLNLLPRFYDPAAGAIRLDGMDVRRIQLKSLRKHIALVLQESVILPTSIRENIAYGRPKATDAEILAAARLAGADEFIERLPERYETAITEGGQNLSGGQRQRIAIARALLSAAPIVVLDEPTSALDAQHEHQIIEALERIKGTRTVIIVSHRLSTVLGCDQIFVMEEGRIVERGRHEELLAKRGRYWELACHQLQLELAEVGENG